MFQNEPCASKPWLRFHRGAMTVLRYSSGNQPPRRSIGAWTLGKWKRIPHKPHRRATTVFPYYLKINHCINRLIISTCWIGHWSIIRKDYDNYCSFLDWTAKNIPSLERIILIIQTPVYTGRSWTIAPKISSDFKIIIQKECFTYYWAIQCTIIFGAERFSRIYIRFLHCIDWFLYYVQRGVWS